jgi:hypothetical protein
VDEQLKARDRLDAMEFIRRCSGIDKRKPGKQKRTTFTVVARSAAELAQLDAPPIAPDPLPSTESGPGAPR